GSPDQCGGLLPARRRLAGGRQPVPRGAGGSAVGKHPGGKGKATRGEVGRKFPRGASFFRKHAPGRRAGQELTAAAACTPRQTCYWLLPNQELPRDAGIDQATLELDAFFTEQEKLYGCRNPLDEQERP